ncbi:Transposase IS200 like protein [Neorhodopirellula pilleata]|uniref:Transposase IS200 like protein n=2 Tax=Neorhodopirellula pilleata TaxID=2714738 RepID=A0A5C6ABD9_9BACT|nr:Transposase IS200 like protein [Neorhodopirellula pilleata]
MSDYRRWFVPGGTYFLTLVTYQRQPILTTDEGRDLLRESILDVWRPHRFKLVAAVLLPDHFHLMMSLPTGDFRYSMRIQRIKSGFTRRWLEAGYSEVEVTEAERKKNQHGIWQPRFWEHTVQDEDDLHRCADYIHWNPRKHELVKRVVDYPWSSFHRFVREGHYELHWGGECPESLKSTKPSWGEP